VLRGRYINLFDADLKVVSAVQIVPQSRMLLFDVDSVKAGQLKVVAAACRVRDEQSDGKTLRFRADGIGDTNGIVGIASPSAPVAVTVGGQPLDSSKYDYSGGLLKVRFPNSSEPVAVEVQLAK